MVAGGIAVNLYGIERATADVDLIIDLDEENTSKFVRVAKKARFKGSKKAMAMGVRNEKTLKRYTYLKERLKRL